MKLYQHVYGRVARGYRSNYGGYQVAALSDSIENNTALVQTLDDISFFHQGNENKIGARYAFLQPATDFLAWGCSRMARDCGGAIGHFTHHFLCKTSEFLQSGVSPAAMFSMLPFVGSEPELPEDRSLPVLDIDIPQATAPAPERRDLALDLLDVFLGESALVVPMVILPESETWKLLHEMFAILPQFEASRLSFSTMFVHATQYVNSFRIVFVPDVKDASQETHIYRLVTPSLDGKPPARIAQKQTPYINFWRKVPVHGQTLRRFINLLRHNPQNLSEECESTSQLLQNPSEFRQAVETLKVPQVYEVVLRDSRMTELYWRAAGPMDSGKLRAVIAADEANYLRPALNALRNLHQEGVCAMLFRDLAVRILRGQSSVAWLSDFAPPDRASFFTAICAGEALAATDLESLAVQLRHERFYSGEIHHALAVAALQTMAGKEREALIERWLTEELPHYGNGFLRAAVTVFSWLPSASSPPVKLEEFDGLTPSNYRHLLAAAWAITPRVRLSERLKLLLHSRHRGVFFSFLAEQLKGFDFNEQCALLEAAAVTCGTFGSDNDPLVGAIVTAEKAPKLARFYIDVLEQLPKYDDRAVASLKPIANQRKSWFGF